MYNKRKVALILIEIVAALAIAALVIWFIAGSVGSAYGNEKRHMKPTPTEEPICTPTLPTPSLEASVTPTAGASATPTPTPTPTMVPSFLREPTPTPLKCTEDTFPSCTVNWEMDRMDCVCKTQDQAIVPAGVPNTGRAEN